MSRSAASTGSPASGWVPFTHLTPDRAVLAVSLLTAAVAGAVVLAVAPALTALDPACVLLFVVLVAVARLASLEMQGRSAYSVAAVPILAAGLLMGVAGAVAVAPLGAVARGIARRTVWYKVLLNASVHVLAAALATSAIVAAGISVETGNLPRLLPVAALAGAIYYLHTFLIATAIGAERRIAPLRIWNESFRWLWPQYLVLGAMALLLALAYHAFGLIGVATFVVPPVMMRYVAKQYLDRTTENVYKLQTLNAQLEIEMAQRVAAERENARLAGEAARASALEELSRMKSEFISIASHELRTPLAAISGYGELLLNATDPDDPRHRWASVLHRNSQQLASLVDNLLDASRIETGRLAIQAGQVDLGELLPAVLDTLEEPQPHHRLVLDVADEARWAWGDREKLRQIVTNLASNAIKYSPDGGEVRVTVRPGEAGWVRMEVADQGVGIAQADMERVFDRFQRLDGSSTRRVRGTGLGLYIVRHLVELHGGTVRVESEVGRGSAFVVTLPTAPPAGSA